jgi:hypothetical protein
MPFFKDLRRRSKASFRTKTGIDYQPNDEMVTSRLSSTPDTPNNTPPSSIRPNLSSPSLPSILKSNGNLSGSSTPIQPHPQRPVPITSQSNRNSLIVRDPQGALMSFIRKYFADCRRSTGRKCTIGQWNLKVPSRRVSLRSKNRLRFR